MSNISTVPANTNSRDFFLDNAKFILIFLVVFAHGISATTDNFNYAKALWTIINIMHMPAFIFISGYLAKGSANKPKVNVQKPFTYFLFYAFAQILVWCFEYFVLGDHSIPKSFFYARSSLWFLQILVTYFILLPFLSRIKPRYVMILTIVCGVLIGFDSKVTHFLSISRLFVHMPFFFAGFYFKKEWLDRIKNCRLWMRFAAGGVIIAFFLAIYFKILRIPGRIITAQYNYNNIGKSYSLSTVWIWRIVFYVVAFILIMAFMYVVPRGKTFFSRFGGRTISVYIFHRLLYLAANQYGWVDNNVTTHLSFLVLTLIIIAVTFILSLKPFDLPFALIRKIRLDKLYNDTNS